MIHVDAPGVLAGAIVLGLVHGVEPGHGWPVAAAYAMDRSNTWGAGLAASLLLGVGHLISSIAVVVAYFFAIAYFDLTSLDEPIVVAGVQVGGPLGIVAGILLIGLGIREYYGGGHGHAHGSSEPHDEHSHGGGHSRGNAHAHDSGHSHGDDHSHQHGQAHEDDHVHEHGHAHADDHSHDHHEDGDPSGVLGRLRGALPIGGGGHEHLDESTAHDRGLMGIAWVAFVLGFAHEEEFEIIALCTGSAHCLELMLAYALTVIFGIVALTMALLAGYQHFEDRVETITPYLPAFSAIVLVVMGLGFLLGLL
ncbi:hypothetical protein L593_01460 [Salinarchaeum sp. Harcht-Bsk1]|uniref:hypothetical protein n=1 Tax=Salinarchaeum sp. Harcht-Bsk1 TaxID=1333523 RepID=UPI0003423ECE|nr:hypothetical protein [Salinarchaeum sp. Harcht-Bsk1]AGN00245.1 hypothetical protein L593_01460 [Salinarchaeum sp. Harcht-Bsk1]